MTDTFRRYIHKYHFARPQILSFKKSDMKLVRKNTYNTQSKQTNTIQNK